MDVLFWPRAETKKTIVLEHLKKIIAIIIIQHKNIYNKETHT